MGIPFTANLEQQGRRGNVTIPGSFFYLTDISDVDISVEKIINDSGDPIEQILNYKYIILDVNNMPPSLLGLSGTIGNGDIVRFIYDSSTNLYGWELYKDVSNSKTDNGLVYDKRTKKYYQYDSVNGWKPILRSGAIDGGTFS